MRYNGKWSELLMVAFDAQSKMTTVNKWSIGHRAMGTWTWNVFNIPRPILGSNNTNFTKRRLSRTKQHHWVASDYYRLITNTFSYCNEFYVTFRGLNILSRAWVGRMQEMCPYHISWTQFDCKMYWWNIVFIKKEISWSAKAFWIDAYRIGYPKDIWLYMASLLLKTASCSSTINQTLK
jgi:hypothetical protein